MPLHRTMVLGDNHAVNAFTYLTEAERLAATGFTTDDFEGARTFLKSLAVNVTERQEEGGKFLHFSDPDGTALYFIKPKW